MIQDLTLLISFLMSLMLIAVLYAAVGHGGASGYLALMALFGFSTIFMRPTALVLNIVVAGISFFYFNKHQYFKWSLFYPFAIASIPASFIGGLIEVETTIYKQVLGVFILFSVLKMLNVLGEKSNFNIKPNLLFALAIGALIGFFSGMIGIGGGIILSPVILLLGWGTVKETAAVSALFIFVNSIAGLLGYIFDGNHLSYDNFYFVPFVLIGGVMGAKLGSSVAKHTYLKYILVAVLVLASVKLFFV